MNKSEQEVTHGSLIFVSTNYMLVDGRFKNNLIDLNKIIEKCSFIQETDEMTYRNLLIELTNEKVV